MTTERFKFKRNTWISVCIAGREEVLATVKITFVSPSRVQGEAERRYYDIRWQGDHYDLIEQRPGGRKVIATYVTLVAAAASDGGRA